MSVSTSSRHRRSARALRIAGPLLAVAATATAVLAFPATASADSSGNWLQNIGNGLCLQPVNGSYAQGAAIVQTGCDKDSAVQRWQVVYSGATVYQVRNIGTGLCLDARGGASNGTPVQQWSCSSISNEKWDSGPDYVTVRSRVSGTSSHCLDVPQQSTQVGMAMQLWGCNNTVAQIWRTTGPDPIIR